MSGSDQLSAKATATSSPTAALSPPHDHRLVRLKVTEVDTSPVQPRQFANESEPDIRRSIEAHGLTQLLSVTIPQGSARYVIAAGGNTRLKILQDLYRETSDEKWLWQWFLLQEGWSELDMHLAHMNEARAKSSFCFWEDACMTLQFRELHMKATGQYLGERELERVLRTSSSSIDGERRSIGRSLLGRHIFAATRLSGLGRAKRYLTGEQVLSTFQPRLNLLCRLAVKFGIEQETFWSQIVTPSLERFDALLPPDFKEDRHWPANACDAVVDALAAWVNESSAAIAMMTSALAVAPTTCELADLRGHVQHEDIPGSTEAISPSPADQRRPAGRLTKTLQSKILSLLKEVGGDAWVRKDLSKPLGFVAIQPPHITGATLKLEARVICSTLLKINGDGDRLDSWRKDLPLFTDDLVGTTGNEPAASDVLMQVAISEAPRLARLIELVLQSHQSHTRSTPASARAC